MSSFFWCVIVSRKSKSRQYLFIHYSYFVTRSFNFVVNFVFWMLIVPHQQNFGGKIQICFSLDPRACEVFWYERNATSPRIEVAIFYRPGFYAIEHHIRFLMRNRKQKTKGQKYLFIHYSYLFIRPLKCIG